MDTTEHIKVSRLMEAALDGLALEGSELNHQATCDACQDLFDIFQHELLGEDLLAGRKAAA